MIANLSGFALHYPHLLLHFRLTCARRRRSPLSVAANMASERRTFSTPSPKWAVPVHTITYFQMFDKSSHFSGLPATCLLIGGEKSVIRLGYVDRWCGLTGGEKGRRVVKPHVRCAAFFA